MAGWLSVAGVLPTQAQTLSKMNLGGYLGVNVSSASASYNAGYSMYVAMLGRSQYAYYSSDFGASLQPGTWMGAQNSKAKCYFDIEGGAGPGGRNGNVWCNNGFGMGVVGPDFAGVANGTWAAGGSTVSMQWPKSVRACFFHRRWKCFAVELAASLPATAI